MKKIKLFIIITAFLSFITACGNKENENTLKSDDTIKENQIGSIEEFESEVKKLGISYDKVQLVAGFVGATEGVKLYIDDSKLEIYKFDENSSDYKNAYKNQKITLNGKDEYKAIVKNGYALLIDKDFPEYDKIILIFERLN